MWVIKKATKEQVDAATKAAGESMKKFSNQVLSLVNQGRSLSEAIIEVQKNE